MNNVITKYFLFKTSLLASVYLIIVTYLMNLSLVENTIFGNYNLAYKSTLLIALLEGMWTAMTHVTLIFLILNSLLTGAILLLLAQKFKLLHQMGKLHIVAGGSSILAIAGAGCSVCGLPVLSLLGLSGAVLYLPFKGGELLYISFFLLLGSFYLLLKSVMNVQACKILVKKSDKTQSFPIVEIIKSYE